MGILSAKYQIKQHEEFWTLLPKLIRSQISADLGRPPTIADEDFDVELPLATELESPYNTLDRPDIPWILKQARDDVTSQRPLYELFRAFASAAPILNRILRGFYSPKWQSSGVLNISLAAALEVELEQWKNTLPVSLADPSQNRLPFARTWTQRIWRCGKMLKLFKAIMVEIEYNCLLLLLHRPFIQHKDPSKPIDNDAALRALSISTRAANRMLDCMERFTTALPGRIYSTLCA